jgi:prolyl-tRNA synthetase
MRLSRHFGKTLREIPKDAQTEAYRLLLRGGYIKQVSAGIYAYMPFFLRSLNKIFQIAREEMITADFEEFLLPLLQPGSFFTQPETPYSYDLFEGIFEFKGSKESRLYLGQSYTTFVADLVGKEISSYKQLPKRLFQIATKFHDENRPRFGLIRAREFIAADAYSFDIDQTAQEASYSEICNAYQHILNRVGVQHKFVEADAESSRDEGCHEFIITTDAGEDIFLSCDTCNYAATRQKSESRLQVYPQDDSENPMEMQEVYGKGLIGVEPLAEFLNIPVWKTTKTLLFQADDKVVAVMVRGDCGVNEAKVKRFLGCKTLSLASSGVIKEITGAEVGYAGPIGLPPEVAVIADHYTKDRVNFECGANRTDYHIINANFGRDFPLPVFSDFKLAKGGEFCPRCEKGVLKEAYGISVGRLVMEKPGDLGNIQTHPTYIDNQGKSQPLMICHYSLGVSRMAAAIIDQSHDEFGIIWPPPVAPFQGHLVALNLENQEVRSEAENLYQKLIDDNVEILFDDRDIRAGEKFEDADLLGIPIRLTISKRTIKEEKIETKFRDRKETQLRTYEEVLELFQSLNQQK